MRPKRHFALKDTFPMETIVKKNLQKNPKISEILLRYFRKKKLKKKIGKNIYFFISRCLQRLGIFFFFPFPAPAAPLFFFNRKMKILRKSEKKNEKKIRWVVLREGQTWKFLLHWKVTLPLRVGEGVGTACSLRTFTLLSFWVGRRGWSSGAISPPSAAGKILLRRRLRRQKWKNVGKTWENVGKTWKNVGKRGKTWKILAKRGKTWENVEQRKRGETW